VYWSRVKPCTGQGLRRGRVLVRGQTVSDSVLVRGSVGVVYWSGVKPCTGQGLRRGRVLVRGQTVVRGCIYIRHMCGCIYLYIYTHLHTHTHTQQGGVSFSTDVSGWPDTIGGVCFAASTLRISSAFSVRVDGCDVEMSDNTSHTVGISSASFVSPKCPRIE
jgi:hypothetical protein